MPYVYSKRASSAFPALLTEVFTFPGGRNSPALVEALKPVILGVHGLLASLPW